MTSEPFQPLPEGTSRAVKSVGDPQNPYLAIGDRLESLTRDLELEALDPFGERTAGALLILAMVTLFQFAEGVPDRQAADALRTRMDWKYALHLPPDAAGIDHGALCRFRDRLRGNEAGLRVLGRMLDRLGGPGLLANDHWRRSDAGRVLAAVDELSALEGLAEAMGLALEAVACRQPDWLRATSLPHWYERYDPRTSARDLPGSAKDRQAQVQAIEADVSHLLESMADTEASDLALLPEVQALRRMWRQHTGVRSKAEGAADGTAA
jgi:transposase